MTQGSQGGLRLRRPLRALQGRYDEAEALCEQSQAIREKVLGPDHPDVADSLYVRALSMYQQVSGNASSVDFDDVVMCDANSR